MKIIKEGRYTLPEWTTEQQCTDCQAILLVEVGDLVAERWAHQLPRFFAMCPICTRIIAISKVNDHGYKSTLRAYNLHKTKQSFTRCQNNLKEKFRR